MEPLLSERFRYIGENRANTVIRKVEVILANCGFIPSGSQNVENKFDGKTCALQDRFPPNTGRREC